MVGTVVGTLELVLKWGYFGWYSYGATVLALFMGHCGEY